MAWRTKMFLAIAFICFGFAAVFYMSYGVKLTSNHYINSADVRGISLVAENASYPVDYERQVALLSFFNAAKSLDPKEDVSKGTKTLFSKIFIYHYKDLVTEVYPIIYLGNELVFQCRDWNQGEMLKDTSQGKLKALLDDIIKDLQERERHTHNPNK